jgi:hypothetical protein
MRFLGRHRNYFNNEILKVFKNDGVVGIKGIEWYDFNFDPNKRYKDAEIMGMDFLPKSAIEKWQNYWPDPLAGNIYSNRKVPNWDAVGILRLNNKDEYILVEAKSHKTEFTKGRPCGAGKKSRIKIQDAIIKTQSAIDINGTVEWLDKYYQVANRIAALNFLQNVVGFPARLVYVLFLGDKFPRGRVSCPKTTGEWENLFTDCYYTLRVPRRHNLSDRIHRVFLHVGGGT